MKLNAVKNASEFFNRDLFTVVGTPTISEDGIASGFTSAKYLFTTKTFNLSEAETWEITTPMFSFEEFTERNWIVTADNIKNSIRLGIRENGSVTFGVWHTLSPDSKNIIFSNDIETSVFQVKVKNFYQAKIGFDGNAYYLKISTEQSDFVEIFRFISTTKLTYNPSVYFGKLSTLTAPDAVMDLKQFLVSIDGHVVFDGIKKRNRLHAVLENGKFYAMRTY